MAKFKVVSPPFGIDSASVEVEAYRYETFGGMIHFYESFNASFPKASFPSTCYVIRIEDKPCL